MKILLVSTHERTGGAAIAANRLMQSLRDHSIQVNMLVQGKVDSEDPVFSTTHSGFKRLTNLRRFIQERLAFLSHEKSRSIRFLFSLANTGEDITGNRHFREADLIHLHWINGGYLSLKSLEKIISSGKPVIWTLHDMWAFSGGCHYALDCKNYKKGCGECPYVKRPSQRDLSNRIWNKKSAIFKDSRVTIVTPSDWLNQCVKESSLLGHCEVHTIRNPVDQTEFVPRDRERAKENLGLDPAKKYILFGAATVKNMLKGFDYFVEAVKGLVGEIGTPENVEILLFGKSKEDLSQLFPIKTHVVSFTGSTDKIVDLYNAAHLFVIPSLQDNLPNTIVESMLCGTPAVGFQTGGIPEMIEHKVSGYLAEYKSSPDLAEGMKWVLDFEDYEALSAKTRECAVQLFSRERSTEQHVKLYRSLLEGNE